MGGPVLSVQMVVAQPMVSAALSLLTRLLSLSIRFTEYARAIVTARGNPSGTATTCICIFIRHHSAKREVLVHLRQNLRHVNACPQLAQLTKRAKYRQQDTNFHVLLLQ